MLLSIGWKIWKLKSNVLRVDVFQTCPDEIMDELIPAPPLGYHCGGNGRRPSARTMTARTAMRLPGKMNAQLHDLAKRDAVSITAIIRRAIAREIALASR
jgi:hypothetical protein